MYTFDNLIDDVKKEAAALKVHATKEELGRLDVQTFCANDFDRCIYGQMTGNCASKRANKLISTCCQVYINNESYDRHKSDIPGFRHSFKLSALNRLRNNNQDWVELIYLSPIEAYIMRPDAKNANLIAYLKGETETLEL